MKSRWQAPIALGVLVLLAGLAGCGFCPSAERLEEELRAEAEKAAAAILARDGAALAGYFSEPARPVGFDGLAEGPLIFRRLELSGISAPQKSPRSGAWRVGYVAELSDYPSALFNSLVEPAVLAEHHRLKPYEELVELSGELVWSREGGDWKIVEAPPPHEPVGRACALAAAADRWRGSLAAATRGIAALAKVVELVSASFEPNHAGPLTRAETLRRVDAKLARAVAEGGAGFVRERFYPVGGESLAGALAAVGELDGVLAAWWSDSLEQAADRITGVVSGEVSLESLLSSPVRLHSYEVTDLEPQGSGAFAVTVAMRVSDVASVYSVAICPHEIPDPRGYIKTIDKGVDVTERFRVERRADGWMVVADEDEGVIGYAARAGRLTVTMREFGPLASDLRLLELDLDLRVTLAALPFLGLDFAPFTEAISKEGRERVSEAVLRNVAGIVGRCLALDRFSSRAKSFYLGRKFSELIGGIGVQRLADEAGEEAEAPPELAQQSIELARDVEGVQADIVCLIKLQRIGVKEAAIESLLRRVRLGRDIEGVFKISGTVRERLREARGATHENIFLIGMTAGVLQMTSLMRDLPGAEPKGKNWEAVRLDDISRLLMKVPGAKLSARVTVARLAKEAEASGHIDPAKIEPLTEYDWYFDEEPQL